MKRILILDANQRSALAATRSLGARGLSIITADSTSSSLAGSSRYATLHAIYPSPHTAPDAFIATLQTLVERHNIDVLLPMTDVTTALVLDHRARLAGVRIPCPDLQAYEQLSDKGRLAMLAARLGVQTPHTIAVDGAAELDAVCDRLTFPVVLKPARSRNWVDGRCVTAPVRYVRSLADLRAALAQGSQTTPIPWLIQEYVPGQGQGVFCLFDRGRPHSFFSHRRLREKPPSGGVSVLSESVPLPPQMVASAQRILSHVGWHGVAMVEFKVTHDGTPYLIEVNGRFWGSLQLAIDAGIDFPYLLYRLAIDKPTLPANGFEVGRRSRWLLGDLDHLYLTLKGRGTEDGFAPKLRALREFLVLFDPRLRYEINRLDDLRPFLFELRHYFRPAGTG